MSSQLIALVAHDAPTVAALVEAVLADAGYQVRQTTVPRTRQAVAAFAALIERDRPAVLLYEVGYPYDEQLRALRRLRKDESVGAVPLVVLTTADPDQIAGLQPGGGVRVLRQPFGVEELLEAARQV